MVAIAGGSIAGAIDYSKNRAAATFLVFFIFGALFPLIGIIVAALTKPAQTVVSGSCQPDPWGQAGLRWHDGYNWTGYTA